MMTKFSRRLFDSFANYGEMAEWSNAADSKSVVLLAVPGVRIPLSPRSNKVGDKF